MKLAAPFPTWTARSGWLLGLVAAAGFAQAGDPGLPSEIGFNRHIRPILADKCFACHGPDEAMREADLRLDLREETIADRGGYRVVLPENPDESELLRRVLSDDEFERMPPEPEQALTPREVDLLRGWITQGAPFEKHWSLILPGRAEIPSVLYATWPGSDIDFFVQVGLDKQGLHPSPDADRRTLIRRLSFDLIGLPPTPDEVDAFLADESPGAYKRVVDRLLASKHFGERMAMYWLDVVRYADSGGYHSDNHREVSPYRDYVIRAFNENLAFDQFTVEQIAGDLLPDATRQQKIASGFNRLLQTTEEGGAQPKEYTAKYQADRVRNTAAAWLGITMGCCECHNHKFDPFSIKDFYSFAAFFADVQERPVGRQEQTALPTPVQERELARLDAALAPLRESLDGPHPELAESQARWEAELEAKLASDDTSASSDKDDLPDKVLAALKVASEERTAEQEKALTDHYRTLAPQLASLRQEVAALEKQGQSLKESFASTLISISTTPRTVRILPRGNWLDDSGEIVQPATPQALPAAQIEQRSRARLDLARWMVSPDNPLVARVFVNRLWKLFFGQGIVTSMDDFGTQGQLPTHPELLDWLAVEFIDNEWDVKLMVKLLVTSRTYRQASFVTAELRERDPSNHWLARQARFRLDAEIIRDNALAISGLLSRRIGGRSVKPYQPAGYWQHLNFPKRKWQRDEGEQLYRRGLYTYWQRTFLHPSLLAFDAPSREECTVERPRSNTPLQALVLLNDPTYVEAARAFAAQIIKRGGATTDDRLVFAFRQALSRPPSDAECTLLIDLHDDHLAQFAERGAEQVAALLEVGETDAPDDIDVADLAAWTSVARVILNLHETITRY